MVLRQIKRHAQQWEPPFGAGWKRWTAIFSNSIIYKKAQHTEPYNGQVDVFQARQGLESSCRHGEQ
jgi:hypothetical protein